MKDLYRTQEFIFPNKNLAGSPKVQIRIRTGTVQKKLLDSDLQSETLIQKIGFQFWIKRGRLITFWRNIWGRRGQAGGGPASGRCCPCSPWTYKYHIYIVIYCTVYRELWDESSLAFGASFLFHYHLSYHDQFKKYYLIFNKPIYHSHYGNWTNIIKHGGVPIYR